MKKDLIALDDAVGVEILKLRALAYLITAAGAEDGIDPAHCDGVALIIEGTASRISEAVKKSRTNQ